MGDRNRRNDSGVVQMKANVGVRARTQWLALGGALVVLAGVLVAWALSRAADRVQVVQVAVDVRAGEVIGADDLVLVGVAHDGSVSQLVPAAQAQDVMGKVAAVDLQVGMLLQSGMWRTTPSLSAGEQRVGVVLKSGRFPADLGQGDTAVAAALDPADPLVPVSVRVLEATATPDGTTALTLAVPTTAAVTVARLGADEQLVLVGNAATGGEGA
jgi:hypothetical protein